MNNDTKYWRYINEFKRSFPNREITDKNYKVSIIRHILMYYLYLEKKKNKSIKHKDIAKIFCCKSSTVCKAIKQVKEYNSLKNINKLGKEKELFKYFYVKFNRIYNNKNK